MSLVFPVEPIGPCDRCGAPVMALEDWVELERRLAQIEGLPLHPRYLLAPARHVLCSPSRRQYLSGQPRAEAHPYNAEMEPKVRAVWAEMCEAHEGTP